MTNFTKTFTLTAAALLVATGVASAQSLKAEIPFAFHVGKQLLPAGTYTVANVSSSANTILALHGDSGPSALALGNGPHDPAKNWMADGRPRLSFACAETCALVEVWTGSGYSAYNLSRPKGSDMGTRIAVIVMRPDKGD